MARVGGRMKFDRNKLKRDFSRAATTYEAESILQRRVLETLISRGEARYAELSSNDVVLDAGCGTGALGELNKNSAIRAQIIGCDLAHGMCVKAMQKPCFTFIINASVEHLPFADKVFEGVISSLTLQWINDPFEALHEWFRVTKDGGFLQVTTFGMQTLKELRNVFSMLDDEPRISPFYSANQLADMLKSTGYTDVATHTESYKYYMPSYLALGKHLRAIGATNKISSRHKGLMSHRQLRKIDEFYHLFYSHPDGLPVTWEVHYLSAKKGRT
jgi:malonyl-CoA O-methyltransferase